MARTNAASELTRFWLQARHGCLIDESIPVPVFRGLSDIDLMAMRPDLNRIALPDGSLIGPRIIIETKAEHDWDPTGRGFGSLLRIDMNMMAAGPFIPDGTSHKAKFSMLRQEHFDVATKTFATEDFDRLFVVHALDPTIRSELAPQLADQWRVHWLTLPELLSDLVSWYQAHPRPTGLRHSPIGDLIHLMIGFCGLRLADEGVQPAP